MGLKKLLQSKNKMLKKMWINQFAFSLFGLFVASAVSGNICVVFGIFSLLFYLSVVGFAILDDAQKDKITFQAGRGEHLTSNTGFMYSFFAFFPSIVLTVAYSIFTFISQAPAGAFKTVYFVLVKYILSGEILGIDVGLTKYTYDAVNQVRTSTAPEYILFLSDHAIFQIIFTLLVPIIFGIIYSLAFKGVISFNTTDTKRK